VSQVDRYFFFHFTIIKHVHDSAVLVAKQAHAIEAERPQTGHKERGPA
jgi:hypothetical protein